VNWVALQAWNLITMLSAGPALQESCTCHSTYTGRIRCTTCHDHVLHVTCSALPSKQQPAVGTGAC
jgi:hypothetical protein